MDITSFYNRPAGTYFMVKDAYTGEKITEINNLRLLPISSLKGPVNNIFSFEKEDFEGFKNVFGDISFKQNKYGNQSIKTALECLKEGPLAVINLRQFNNQDTIGCLGINSNINFIEETSSKYSSVFNTNNLWTVKPENICNNFKSNHVLNIANIGSKDVSLFAVFSNENNINSITEIGYSKLSECGIEIDDLFGIDKDMLLKDTIIDIYVFENTFNKNSKFNNYYGYLFDDDGCIEYDNLSELSNIPSSKFVKRITGSLIPDIDISIDNMLNSCYDLTGLLGYLNIDIFENEQNFNVIDKDRDDFYSDSNFELLPNVSPYILSHKLKPKLDYRTLYYPPLYSFDINIDISKFDRVFYQVVKIDDDEFECCLEHDLKLGDIFTGLNRDNVKIIEIEELEKIDIKLRKHTREFTLEFD